MCEETVDEPHLIDDEEAEDETDEPRHKTEAPIETDKTVFGERKGDGNGGGDEHHACDSAESEYEKINDCPRRNPDCGENEQGNSRGTGQTVDDPDR